MEQIQRLKMEEKKKKQRQDREQWKDREIARKNTDMKTEQETQRTGGVGLEKQQDKNPQAAVKSKHFKNELEIKNVI